MADMEADDKWAVASNKALKSHRATTGPSLDHRGSILPQRLVASKRWRKVRKGRWPKWSWKSRVRGKLERGREGWGETHSQQAVEELHEWLLQGNNSIAAPPPLYDQKDRAKRSPPSPTITRVEEPSRIMGGILRHVTEQRDCEQRFKTLTFAAIEPFSEEGMQWHGGEVSPSPLQPMA